MKEHYNYLFHPRNQVRFMQWDITKRCNLKCKHCRSTDYYEGAKGDKIKDLTTEEVFRTLDDLAKNGVNRIHFLGGEPFIRNDLLDIIKFAGKLGIVCSINTNGTLITQDLIPKLFDSNVYLLTFSLDGASSETNDKIRGKGVFELVCKNIKEIDKVRKERKKYLRMIYTPVITKINRHESKELCHLAKDLGLDSVIITTLRKKGRAKENITKLGLSINDEIDVAEEISELIASGFKQHIQLGVGTPLTTEYLNKKYSINLPISPGGCNSLILKGFIQPDGTLFPCQELTSFYTLYNEKHNIKRSKILENGFNSIWNSKEYINLLEKLFNIDISKSNIPCGSCKYAYSYCYPCPLPSLKDDGPIYHQSCIETLERAKKYGINLDENSLKIHSSTVLQKAKDNPFFRIELLFNTENILEKNKFILEIEEMAKLKNILNNIKENVRKNINIYLRGGIN